MIRAKKDTLLMYPFPRIPRIRSAVAPFLLSVSSVLFAQPPASSSYYRHVTFDNSITKDSYYFSRGESNGQSSIQQENGRLPVDSQRFRTPPNAIRIQWQSAPNSGWTAAISQLDFRNRRPGLDGHNLYFWIYSPQSIAAADMPRLVLSTSSEGLQVAEFPAS